MWSRWTLCFCLVSSITGCQRATESKANTPNTEPQAAATAPPPPGVPVAAEAKVVAPAPAQPKGAAPDKVATAIMGTPIYRHAVRSVAYSPDGTLLAAGCGDGTVFLWDVKLKKVVRTIKAHEDWAFDLTFTPDGLLVSGGGDNLVRLIDPQTATVRETFEDHTNDLHGVAVTTDGKWLVTVGDDKRVLIRSLMDKTVAELGQHERQVTSVTISRDDRFAATSSRDGTVKIWDLRERKLVRTYKSHTADVISVAFSPDGSKLVSGGHDKTVREWDAANNERDELFTSHGDWIFAVLFSKNGALVMDGCGDNMFRMFRETDRKLVFEANLAAHVADLALSPDGKIVAAATSDGAVWFITVDGENSKVLPEKLQVPPVTKLPPITQLNVDEYLKAHRAIALREKDWMKTAAGMTDSGDAFTLFLLDKIDEKTLQPDEAEVRQRVMQQIEKRRGDKPGNVRKSEIGPMLLRASIADLKCDPLEGVFAPWLIVNLKSQATSPPIRQELEALLVKPPVSAAVEKQPWGVSSDRIKQYINRILDDKGDKSD